MDTTIDTSDPISSVVAFVVTWLIRLITSKLNENLATFVKRLSPIIAVLAAVFFRVVWDAMSGVQFTTFAEFMGALLHGLAAGAVAVMATSQWTGLMKQIQSKNDPAT